LGFLKSSSAWTSRRAHSASRSPFRHSSSTMNRHLRAASPNEGPAASAIGHRSHCVMRFGAETSRAILDRQRNCSSRIDQNSSSAAITITQVWRDCVCASRSQMTRIDDRLRSPRSDGAPTSEKSRACRFLPAVYGVTRRHPPGRLFRRVFNVPLQSCGREEHSLSHGRPAKRSRCHKDEQSSPSSSPIKQHARRTETAFRYSRMRSSFSM